MQRWEYTTRFPMRPYKHIKDEYLNQLGADGWELVNVAPYPRLLDDANPPSNGELHSGPTLIQIMYVFKRPLESHETT